MNEIVESLVDRLNPLLREAYEERAAIMQFDAGLQRDLAEALPVTNRPVLRLAALTTIGQRLAVEGAKRVAQLSQSM